MSRSLRRLRDWPECPKKLTDAELEAERKHWLQRATELGHREAIKGCRDRARDVEKRWIVASAKRGQTSHHSRFRQMLVRNHGRTTYLSAWSGDSARRTP